MKIGVYGGTFNPPHLGHLAAARAVFELLKLDLLLLVPDGQPPHKDLPAGSPTAEQRLEMTRLAGEQLGLGSKVETLDMEVRRAGKSFTSDTLAELKAQFPEDELWLLMGTDMFLTLQTWHEPEKILSLAGIAAFGRTEEDTEELFSVQRDYLYRTYPQARIFTLTIPGVVDVSSTELREKLARGEGGCLLPPAVYGYILREGLYNTRADLKHLPLDQLRPVALSYLRHKRIPHVLGTEQEAIRLAERYGADVEKARVAALLHDCTKKLDMEEQLVLCRHYGIELDELEQKALKLLHKSNPTVFEWFSSPIVYQTTDFTEAFKPVMRRYFSSKSGLWHYLQMAEGNYREYLRGDMVKAKKYFYVLRPILACRWILEKGTPPPMLFSELAASQLPDYLEKTVAKLLDLKMNSPEVKMIPRIDILNAYMDRSIAEVRALVEQYPREITKDWEELNALFLAALEM